MATVVDIEALKKEIEADRKEMERLVSERKNELEAPILEKEAAYRYLVKLGDNPFIQKGRVISASSPLGENIPAAQPLSKDIKDVLPLFGDAEFINAQVEMFLGKEGIRPRITNELTKLVDQGFLECTSVGKGRTPSRFKVKNSGQEVKA